MTGRAIFRARCRTIIPILALLFAVGLSAQVVFGGRLTDTTAGLQKQNQSPVTAAISSQAASQKSLRSASTGLLVAPKSAAPNVSDAYLALEPSIDHFGSYSG